LSPQTAPLREPDVRLVTFQDGDATRAGELVGDEILISTADCVLDLLCAAQGDAALVDVVRTQRSDRTVALHAVQLLAPINRPARNIFAVGWNYLDHFEEGDASSTREMPSHPTFFTKSPSTSIGANDPIRYDAAASQNWDYEAEVALVIGTAGRDIAEADAPDHIAGYLLANDVTVRDVQRRHGDQWFKGKSFDGTCPLGPALVTPDEIDGPIEFSMQVDGVVEQHASTAQMYFSFARIIAELSIGMQLRTGDVVLCGTPSGVGYAQDPPRWLTPGQVLTVTSPQLGELRNTVRQA
jgi:2,4-diketo-3-deoxy-L-fuconate hydrolase